MATAERILDAAGTLFAERGVDAVEMKDIARAASCSRATLYRYFDSRGSLHTAYVHREARAVGRRLAELVTGIADPPERLMAAMTQALRLVRENPSLAAWFAGTSAGSREAAESEVVAAMTAAFLRSLGLPGAELRARWLVRVLTSLLVSPGRDADDERRMLTEFVIPVLLARTAPG